MNSEKPIETLSEAFESQFDDLEVMRQILWGDIVQLMKEAEKLEDIRNHNARSLIRACYTFMDAVATRAAPLATTAMMARGDSLNKKQVDNMVKSISRQIPENRTDENKDRRSFCDKIKESLKEISKFTGNPFDLSTQNVEWGEFKVATKVRDRITHPKVASDFLVKKDELIAVIRSTYWYQDMLNQVCLKKRAEN